MKSYCHYDICIYYYIFNVDITGWNTNYCGSIFLENRLSTILSDYLTLFARKLSFEGLWDTLWKKVILNYTNFFWRVINNNPKLWTHFWRYAVPIICLSTHNICLSLNRKGHDAGDHPPITPMRSATEGELDNDSWRLYDYITRHFIGTVSSSAWCKCDFSFPANSHAKNMGSSHFLCRFYIQKEMFALLFTIHFYFVLKSNHWETLDCLFCILYLCC